MQGFGKAQIQKYYHIKNINLRYLYKTYILSYYENEKDGKILALF